MENNMIWYSVYVDGRKEAGSNNLRLALQYAMQYATERSVKVQVKYEDKVIVTLGDFFYEAVNKESNNV
jgi:hypothetical protein